MYAWLRDTRVLSIVYLMFLIYRFQKFPVTRQADPYNNDNRSTAITGARFVWDGRTASDTCGMETLVVWPDGWTWLGIMTL
jgi:hypothetical protein